MKKYLLVLTLGLFAFTGFADTPKVSSEVAKINQSKEKNPKIESVSELPEPTIEDVIEGGESTIEDAKEVWDNLKEDVTASGSLAPIDLFIASIMNFLLVFFARFFPVLEGIKTPLIKASVGAATVVVGLVFFREADLSVVQYVSYVTSVLFGSGIIHLGKERLTQKPA